MVIVTEEAKRSLLKNRKILDSLAIRLSYKKQYLQDLKQIVYYTFLKYYHTYNKDKSSIANWVLTVLRLRVIREWHNSSFYVIRLPVYVTEIIRRYKKGLLTGDYDTDRSLIDRWGMSRIKESHYNFIINNYCHDNKKGDIININDETMDSFFYGREKSNDLFEPEQIVEDELYNAKVEYYLDMLPELQRDIIKLFYGIDINKPYSVEELSKLFSMPSKKILSQKNTAIEKLRRLAKHKRKAIRTIKNVINNNRKESDNGYKKK